MTGFLRNIIIGNDFPFYLVHEELIYGLLGLIGLIVIGLVIIVVIRLLFALIPAAIAAFIVWFLTGNLWWTGIAFLIITALSILKKL